MFNIGDTVFALWSDTGHYYLGTIVGTQDDKYYVVFADGDQGLVPGNKLQSAEIEEGQKVYAMWTDKRYYPGTIQKVTGLAVYIQFDDGDKGWTSFAGLAKK